MKTSGMKLNEHIVVKNIRTLDYMDINIYMLNEKNGRF